MSEVQTVKSRASHSHCNTPDQCACHNAILHLDLCAVLRKLKTRCGTKVSCLLERQYESEDETRSSSTLKWRIMTYVSTCDQDVQKYPLHTPEKLACSCTCMCVCICFCVCARACARVCCMLQEKHFSVGEEVVTSWSRGAAPQRSENQATHLRAHTHEKTTTCLCGTREDTPFSAGGVVTMS